MTEQNANPAGSRKIWMLGGLLAVVAVAGYFSLNYPPAGEDAAGTIVPAVVQETGTTVRIRLPFLLAPTGGAERAAA